MQAPKINVSQFQEILQQAKALVPFYTPEWKVTDEKTPDTALLKIFASMVETVISRLNRVPDKNLIAFLDMLGIKLIPAQSARAPVTFILSQGAAENVLIPERSQAAVGELIFETEKNFLATPAKLTDAYSLNIGEDGIFKSPLNIIAGKTVSPLSTLLTYKANTGETDLFLDDVSGIEKGDALKIGESEYITVTEVSDTRVSIDAGLTRDLKAATSVEKITVFELFEGKNRQEHVLYLGHKDLFNIKPSQGSPSKLTLSFEIPQSAQPNLTFEWSYWGENPATKEDEWIVTTPEKPEEDGTSGLTKNGEIVLPIRSEVKDTEVNGIKSRWLRCRVKAPISKTTKLPILASISVVMGNMVIPEMAFYNDVPLDLTLETVDEGKNFKEILYPFGKKPRLFDTFYLGSQEAFSKKGAVITLNFSIPSAISITVPTGGFAVSSAEVETPPTQEEPTLSWEYWNGKGWTVIEIVSGREYRLIGNGMVSFNCPSDIEVTQISGQKNYWVRVRIVGGDYGKEIVYKGNNEWGEGSFSPPYFNKITVTYSQGYNELEQCLIYNNLEFVNVTEESKTSDKPFKPFRPLDEEHQTLYLGFDKKLESGPISIFFALEEAKYTEQTMPKIEWEYFAGKGQSGEWIRLEVLDGTRNLTRSGTVEFVVPKDFAASTKFGSELYWIRAVDAENRFRSLYNIIQSLPQISQAYVTSYLRYVLFSGISLPEYVFQPQIMGNPIIQFGEYKLENPTGESLKEETIEPCPPNIAVFNPSWVYSAEVRSHPLNPRISGIYLNATWAIQAETMRGEIIGSSDGTAKQNFTLTKMPAISEEIWVDELNALSEAEMNDILTAGEPEAEDVKDDKGNITKFWVKWQAADDLLASSKDDRHYEIDRISGNVIFGDGNNGAIPPAGKDNIKADYRSGGGKSGNVGSSTITALKTSIPFVDKVSNPVAGKGGSDTEVMEEALERGPQIVKLRNRAVASEDFEWLAKEASPGIARAKCLPNFDDKGEHEPGWVTVIITPESEDVQPKPSLELLSQVEKYLKGHSANTVVSPEHLQVSGPVYVAVGVEAAIVATSMDAIPLVEKEACSKLKEFLHPLTGGYEKKGWDFGKMPCLSDLFALLEKITGVNYVKDLSVRIKAGEEQIVSELVMSPERTADIKLPLYTLIFSGEHKITVTYEKES